ncbi:hypothetical protein F0L68_21900 [Solihabitans fulvus]|uniref:Uncharacterized protein n=1 Tax=Solihabitans fulvus TaxID=1892852 RepID=A0A5B2X7H0_9PSEU|nr:hypothetical protein [Solihabitans fulvus]KAA2259165.1 hypothetical protein F0L68_21900 [Solihabitans fulvus]
MAKRSCFRASNNQYVRAEGVAMGEPRVPPATGPDPWEIFTKTDAGGGLITLRAANGSYLSAVEGGGGVESAGLVIAGRVVVNRLDSRDAETFVVDESTYSPATTFRAANGRYVSAEQGGGGVVHANRPIVGGGWERFTLGTVADGVSVQAQNANSYWQVPDTGAAVLANGASVGTPEKFVREAGYDRARPKKLLVYYAWPSAFDGGGGVYQVAKLFAQYEYVILGGGVEDVNHGDHRNTTEIIAAIRDLSGGATIVFGYLPLGNVPTTPGYSLDELGRRAGAWRSMGVTGVLVDQFGYEFLTGDTNTDRRNRQNGAVDRIHDYGLSVAANGSNPDQVFNTADGGVAVGGTDFYFSESYQIEAGHYQTLSAWHDKAEKVRDYQSSVDFRVLVTTTTTDSVAYTEALFFYAWYSAMLYGYEAIAWGEPNYSAISNTATFRRRPGFTPGYFTAPTSSPSTGVYERTTDGSTLYVDTNTNTAGTR